MARVTVVYEDECRLCSRLLVLQVERFPQYDKRGAIAPVDITEQWWTFVATGPYEERVIRGVICESCIRRLLGEKQGESEDLIARLKELTRDLPPAPWSADIDDPGTESEYFTGKFNHPGIPAATALYDAPGVARQIADLRNEVAKLFANLERPTGRERI